MQRCRIGELWLSVVKHRPTSSGLEQGMAGLLLSDDLIFSSKVTGTAVALGLKVRVARTPEALLALATQEPPTGVILDLHHPQLDLASLLPALPPARVIAYGSHVEAETLRAARAAGCTLVLPRSAFVERLPLDLAEWIG